MCVCVCVLMCGRIECGWVNVCEIERTEWTKGKKNYWLRCSLRWCRLDLTRASILSLHSFSVTISFLIFFPFRFQNEWWKRLPDGGILLTQPHTKSNINILFIFSFLFFSNPSFSFTKWKKEHFLKRISYVRLSICCHFFLPLFKIQYIRIKHLNNDCWSFSENDSIRGKNTNPFVYVISLYTKRKKKYEQIQKTFNHNIIEYTQLEMDTSEQICWEMWKRMLLFDLEPYSTHTKPQPFRPSSGLHIFLLQKCKRKHLGKQWIEKGKKKTPTHLEIKLPHGKYIWLNSRFVCSLSLSLPLL